MRLTSLPAWSPILCFALAMWASSAVLLQRLCGVGCMHLVALTIMSLVLLALTSIAALRMASIRFVAIVLTGVFLGVLVAAIASIRLSVSMQESYDCKSDSLSIVVTEDSKSGEFGSACIGLVRLPDGNMVRARINLPDGDEADCWEVIHLKASIESPSDSSREYYWSKGLVGSLSPSSIRKESSKGILGIAFVFRSSGLKIIDCASSTFGKRYENGCSLLKAILFGNRRDLNSSDVSSMVKTVGLSHIVAVSGAHLVIVTGLIGAALNRIVVPRRYMVPCQLLLMIIFALIAGLPVSVIRAVVMTTISMFSVYAGKRNSSINALSICIVMFLLLDPWAGISISFAMSALSSLGIALLGKKVSSWISSAMFGRFTFLSDALAVCISANIATLPLSAATFGQLPLISPVTNVVLGPAFPILMVFGLLGLMLCALFNLSTFVFLMPAAYCAELFCEVLERIASIPFACIPVDMDVVFGLCVSGGLALVAFFAKQNIARTHLCALVCVSVAAFVGGTFALPGFSGTQIAMLDVGQGDAILFKDAGHAVLLDTGTNDPQVLAALGRCKVTSLDAVVISHPDDDHCGSLPVILSSVTVNRVCVAEELIECDASNCKKLRSVIGNQRICALGVGDFISFGPFSFEVTSPDGFRDDGGNADSLVLKVRVDCDGDGQFDWKMLASGDAEADVLEPLAETGILEDIDILKVPHHGSKGALSDELLACLKPEIALIGVGENNRYGHPNCDTLRLLDSYGCRVYRTDQSGDVVCNLYPDVLKVRQLK